MTEMTPKRARELVRACQTEYDFRFREFGKAQRELEKAEHELAAAMVRLARLTAPASGRDTPDSSTA